jgi:hypothetical protein
MVYTPHKMVRLRMADPSTNVSSLMSGTQRSLNSPDQSKGLPAGQEKVCSVPTVCGASCFCPRNISWLCEYLAISPNKIKQTYDILI